MQNTEFPNHIKYLRVIYHAIHIYYIIQNYSPFSRNPICPSYFERNFGNIVPDVLRSRGDTEVRVHKINATSYTTWDDIVAHVHGLHSPLCIWEDSQCE